MHLPVRFPGVILRTVEGHIKTIKEKEPEILDVYKTLGMITVEMD